MENRHNITELNQLFSEGETADQELFAEQRSNIQLIAGDHYAKKGNKFWNRLRDNRNLNNEQKIRLTKNHIRKIVHIYRNAITSYAPGVFASAKDKNSLQHQKASELVNSVWQDGKQKHDFNAKINQWASDYVGIGEVAVKIFWDPMAGKFLGMQAQVDEMGQPQMDENGQPISDGTPKFAGDVMIERIFAFNLIRPNGIKVMKESPWLCHRKMVSVDDLKALVDGAESIDPEEKTKIKQRIVESPDQTYVVLDNNTGQYKQVKNQTMLKEWFFRPCAKYPTGYFYITTNEDILFEGELPFGIFPIVFEGFDETQTSPRYRSVVKQLRPNQVEINRCASTIAETQITLGWDKVLVQNGTKLVPGMSFPGVRSFSYSGMAPVVLEGRTGNQYLEYMNSQIDEIYKIAMVEEQVQEKEGNFDVYSMLHRSIKDKKKFSLYTDGFESFLKNVFTTYIYLAQKYYTPQHLIPAIGKSEYITVDEFKGVNDLCYSTKPEPMCDDGETQLGEQLMIQHLIQYIGPQLAKDDLGKLIRLLPFSNDKQILEDLTLDYDTSTNYILALDRGKPLQPNQYDNHEYLIRKFTSRTRKADFESLGPQIAQLYAQAIQMHEQLKTDQEMKIKQAQSEFIPTGGYLVACDFYVPDPNNPEKLPKRVRLPSEAMSWLIKQLDSQGTDQQTLQNLSQGALSEMSSMFMNKLGPSGGGMQTAMPPQGNQMMSRPAQGGMNGRY